MVLSDLTILIQKWPVESVVDLEHWEMFEILLHTSSMNDCWAMILVRLVILPL